jgi:hypothetical protein
MSIIDEYRVIVSGYNKSVPLEDIAARLIRPNDQVIGGTAETYSATYTNATDEYLLAQSAPNRVPIGQGVLSLGWYTELDLGANGILEIDLEGIKRQEVMARFAYNCDMHLYIEPQQVVFAKENDKIAWIIYNAAGLDLTGVVYPFAFLIGPRKQLLV